MVRSDKTEETEQDAALMGYGYILYSGVTNGSYPDTQRGCCNSHAKCSLGCSHLLAVAPAHTALCSRECHRPSLHTYQGSYQLMGVLHSSIMQSTQLATHNSARLQEDLAVQENRQSLDKRYTVKQGLGRATAFFGAHTALSASGGTPAWAHPQRPSSSSSSEAA